MYNLHIQYMYIKINCLLTAPYGVQSTLAPSARSFLTASSSPLRAASHRSLSYSTQKINKTTTCINQLIVQTINKTDQYNHFIIQTINRKCVKKRILKFIQSQPKFGQVSNPCCPLEGVAN